MKRRRLEWAACLLVGLIVFGLTGPAARALVPQPFKDVNPDAWYAPYIRTLKERGVVKGFGDTGEFRPQLMLIREHAAKMAARGASLDFLGKKASIPDVDPEGEMSPYIHVLEALGAFSCDPEGNFRPRDRIKRGEAARMVARAFDLKMGDRPSSYIDLPRDPEIREAILILASHGIVRGYDGGRLFRPEGEISRALFSRIICLAIEAKARERTDEDPADESRDRAEDLSHDPPPGREEEDPVDLEEELEDPEVKEDQQEEVPGRESKEPEEERKEEEDEEPGPDFIGITGLSVHPEELFLMAGEEADLEVLVEPSDATDFTLTWFSEDEKVAQVEEGRVTALAEGETVIRVQAGEVIAFSRVTVLTEDLPVYNQTLGTRHPGIQEAIDRAGEGHVLMAGPKTYKEAVRITKKALTLRSIRGPEETLIDAGGGSYGVQVAGSGLGPIHLEGFTVKGWYSGGINQPMAHGGEGGAFHILNNIVEAPSFSLLYSHAIQVSGDGSKIQGNQVSAYRANDPRRVVSGILVINAKEVLVEENDVYGGDLALTIQGGVQGYPTRETRRVLVLNNHLHDVETGISLEGHAYELTIRDNHFGQMTWMVKKKMGGGGLPDLDLQEVLEENTWLGEFEIIEDRGIGSPGGGMAGPETGEEMNWIEEDFTNPIKLRLGASKKADFLIR